MKKRLLTIFKPIEKLVFICIGLLACCLCFIARTLKPKSRWLTLLGCSLSVILLGVISHYTMHLAPMSSNGAEPFARLETVTVSAKAYNASESRRYLAHDLTSRGIQPLHISVTNHSSREYSLCASSIGLPHIDPKKTAFAVAKSAIPRAIAYKIASLIFWPISLPSSIDGFRTYTHHRKLKADYRSKAFRERGEVIPPYATVHRILFVPKEKMERTFSVTLIDLETLEQSHFQVSNIT